MNKNPSKIEFENVWEHKPDHLIEEIVDTWKSNNLIPPQLDAYERAREVVYVVRSQGAIIGLTTAKRIMYATLKNEVFFYRGMVLPQHRIPGIFMKMTTETIKVLEAYTKAQQGSKPIGVIAELENPKLREMRLTRLPSGLQLIGFSQRDLPIYVTYFKDARF
ncbi:MAG: hypothetical protein Tsb0034_05540 [Ekhidna sp.]